MITTSKETNTEKGVYKIKVEKFKECKIGANFCGMTGNSTNPEWIKGRESIIA